MLLCDVWCGYLFCMLSDLGCQHSYTDELILWMIRRGWFAFCLLPAICFYFTAVHYDELYVE